MKLASSIHPNSIQIQFTFDFNLIKSSSVSCPKNVPGKFILRRPRAALSETVPSCKDGGGGGRSPVAHIYSTVARARRTEREQEPSTSRSDCENEAFGIRSPEGIDANESSCEDTSPGISGETTSTSADYDASIRTVGLCVFAAVAFGVGLGFKDGIGKSSEFFAGYLLEQSLSVDNLFVFILIFKYFKVPLDYQSRVLSYGIVGAVIFRLSLILLGTATLQRFEAVNLLLAAILLYSSFKLFSEDDEDTDLSDNFIVKTCQKFIPVTSFYDGNRFITIQDGVWKATPLLLTVVVIELSDIAFAVDSIPAVFGVTRDPFIVLSSNFFAILGFAGILMPNLFILFKVIFHAHFRKNGRFRVFAGASFFLSGGIYVLASPAIGVVLGFIGCKMILDFFGFHISTEVSLGLVTASLMSGVCLSLIKKND